MNNDTKKPDPIFAHHPVVRERPAQESNATTASNYKREGFTHCGVCDQILPRIEKCIPRRAVDHQNPAPPEAKTCDDGNTVITPKEMTNCWECDYPGIKSEMVTGAGGWLTHQTCARPEAKACDDGNNNIAPARLPCIVCGVPLCDKTPGAEEWSFISRVTGNEKRGLCHEACVATMETILSKKEATK